MSQRKLQQEIDKVFKKVKEGLEIFDGYYEKLQNCDSQSQKEKLEGDLKREIKKLQRQRDQIKLWLSGNEVKEKNQLMENRRSIENAMERFKVVEKNMKTKAFSKEGLSMQRIDPKEKEKNECSDFLHQMIEELERQCEKLEAKVDQIHSSVKKGKKLDNNKQQQVDELNEKLSRHHWHQEKLEQILRFLENDALEAEQVNNLQDDIKYYVESNEEADFAEDEGIYDELGLEDFDDTFGNVGDYAVDSDPEQPPASSASSVAPVAQIVITGNSTPRKSSLKSTLPSTTAINTASSTHTTAAPVKISTPTTSSFPSSNAFTTLKPSIPPKADIKFSTIASSSIAQPTPPQSTISTPKAKPATISNAPSASSQVSSATADSKVTKPSSPINTPTEGPSSHITAETKASNVYEDLIPNYEKVKQFITTPRSFSDISKYLETSLLNCPDSLDSDKPTRYEAENPYPTSISYPQEPLTELCFSNVVSKLDESTLFYNFYYEQGRYIQLLSARALVSKGWKFDGASQKWYKEYQEIKAPDMSTVNSNSLEKTTTWNYFDNEDVWISRRKDDFDISRIEFTSSF
ncbi:hypothetical protein WICPIJ_004837 [Wickerhamomyces pijperi]|uniref:General negative regulator of transcription subunit n=1 Tax=Wickerhamomyces pijperi TaxID=599730 RepID=A0A9P8Q7C7_WICPI|nr:hypothetical protein WICPIJ_004837 [Wickerhamomyces pijperi]